MFENETQEVILERMIEKAGDGVNVIEGSLIYSALSLCAVALEDAYDKLEETYQNAFEDTCDREHLIRFARKKNLFPIQATKARYIVSANVSLAEGDELTDGEKNYTVISDGVTAVIECETAGKEGNTISGELSAVTYIEGFESCTVISQIIKGEDEEETESFRERYLDALNVNAQYGNRAGYRELTEGLDGVGRAFVTAAEKDGLKWVKIFITDEELSSPTEEKVSEVQRIIDPENGSGEGLASIGHRVEIKPAQEVTVNITAELTLEEKAKSEDILPLIERITDEYFFTLNDSFGRKDIVIRRNKIESAALNIDGVVDFEILTLGNSSSNLILPEGCVAKRGEINI